MEIYLLRHGASTSNEKRIVCGAADYPLSEKGKAQALQVCRSLEGIPFTRVYTSPLSRARETIVNLSCASKASVEPELVELNTGAVSHITVDELWEGEPRYRYQGLYPDFHYPEGECLNDMLARVGDWFEAKLKEWALSDTILIAGHEGTVCGILHRLLKLELNNYPTFTIGNCDYIRVTVNQDHQIRYQFFPLVQVEISR